MRVTVAELADYCAIGQLRPNDTVTIIVYDITNGATPLLDDDSCTEYPAANTTGAFYWSFSNLNAQPAAGTVRQYLWIMTNLTGSTYSGTVMVGGVHDETLKKIGTPVALDGAAATLAGMLTKMADDNGGADFDATRDSQNKIAVALQTIDANVDVVLEDTGTTLPGTLTTIEGKVDTVDGNVDDIETLLGTVDGKVDVIDGNVDSILVDTGTDIPASIAVVDGVADAIKAKTDGLNFTGTDVKATLDGEEVDLSSDSLDNINAEALISRFQKAPVG